LFYVNFDGNSVHRRFFLFKPRTVLQWPMPLLRFDSNTNSNASTLVSVHWSGPDCKKHNLVYFTSFSVIFYCITLCCFIQLGICIRSEYAKQKQKSLNQACRITVQKFLYSCSAVSSLDMRFLLDREIHPNFLGQK
jgi:hypothetical protein